MACAKCHPACSKMLRQFAPVRAITRPFDSKIHPVGAIRANRRLLCATWWLICAKGRQIGLNLPPLGATCRLYKYRPSATWFRPSSAAVWTTSLLTYCSDCLIFARVNIASTNHWPLPPERIIAHSIHYTLRTIKAVLSDRSWIFMFLLNSAKCLLLLNGKITVGGWMKWT